MTLDDIIKLIGAPESATLEFKGAPSLARTGSAPLEMVKDISGMANGAGGRIIYGLAERKHDGRAYADRVDPVSDPTISIDWMMQVVAANTAPPLGSYSVRDVPVDGGRVLVVDIAPGDTAHQNNFDHKYYQRIGTQTKPMVDFQIRDVMNRRTAPVMTVHMRRQVSRMTTDQQIFHYEIGLENVGVKSLEGWILDLDYPKASADAARASTLPTGATLIDHIQENGKEWLRYRFLASSDELRIRGLSVIHPQQTVSLGASVGLGQIKLAMDRDIYRQLDPYQIPIRWRLFMPDSKPLQGEAPFSEWAHF